MGNGDRGSGNGDRMRRARPGRGQPVESRSTSPSVSVCSCLNVFLSIHPASGGVIDFLDPSPPDSILGEPCSLVGTPGPVRSGLVWSGPARFLPNETGSWLCCAGRSSLRRATTLYSPSAPPKDSSESKRVKRVFEVEEGSAERWCLSKTLGFHLWKKRHAVIMEGRRRAFALAWD